MYFFIVSIVLTLLYVYFGLGITILICPQPIQKFSLYFSPFVGLSCISYLSWIFIVFFHLGINDFSKYLLLLPLIFLIISYIYKKSQLQEFLWPLKKGNFSILVLCLIIFIGISSPYFVKNISLNNVMTLGNNDIVEYTTISKYLLNPVNFSSDDIIFQHFNFLISTTNFGAYISTAIPSSIFNIDPYKLQNLIGYLFYIFSIPIIFLICTQIFYYNKNIALIITSISGISFHLLYILFHGFQGQIIGMGFFLALFFIICDLIQSNPTRKKLLSFSLLTIILFIGLIITYSPLFPLLIAPISLYLILSLIFFDSKMHFINCILFFGASIFLTLIISPFQFLTRILALFNGPAVVAGWNFPVITPDWMFGIFLYQPISNGLFFWVNGTPFIERVIVSIPVVILIFFSIHYLYNNNKKIFLLSISCLLVSVGLYCYFIYVEFSSPEFTGEGYKAYKLITYFLPIILISGLCYFQKFKFKLIKEGFKLQLLIGIILGIILCANIFSAGLIIEANYRLSTTISENIIDLQNISKYNNVTSVNIIEPPWWDQMWIYYFLFDKQTVYLKYSSYYPASPLIGQWTLKKAINKDILFITNLTDSRSVLMINDDFYLERENIFSISLDKGWYDLESNEISSWRWSGAKNETPTIIITNKEDNQYIDLTLNSIPLNPNNSYSVVLDGKNIMECPNNSCEIEMIYLTIGNHIISFDPKIPPQSTGTNDPRYLGYLFTNITFNKISYLKAI